LVLQNTTTAQQHRSDSAGCWEPVSQTSSLNH